MTAPVPSVRIEAKDAEALFDTRSQPTYPHVGRPLHSNLAQYLELRTREMPRAKAVEIVIALRTAPLAPVDEDRLRGEVRTYFAEEKELADLDVRVNRIESGGSFRFGIPLIVVALAIAGVFYLAVPEAVSPHLIAFITTLCYLVFITVVWVLLWDPIEKFLFDGFFLRRRREALVKLAGASIRFTYVPSGAPGA